MTSAYKIQPIPPEMFPPGTRGVHGWVVCEGGVRETALLIFEPDGVLGEDTHSVPEVSLAVRGELRIRTRFNKNSLDWMSRTMPSVPCFIEANRPHTLTAGPQGAVVMAWWVPGSKPSMAKTNPDADLTPIEPPDPGLIEPPDPGIAGALDDLNDALAKLANAKQTPAVRRAASLISDVCSSLRL